MTAFSVHITDLATAEPLPSRALPSEYVVHIIVGAECISSYPAVVGQSYPEVGVGVIEEAAGNFAIITRIRRDGGSLVCVDQLPPA